MVGQWLVCRSSLSACFTVMRHLGLQNGAVCRGRNDSGARGPVRAGTDKTTELSACFLLSVCGHLTVPWHRLFGYANVRLDLFHWQG